MPLPSVDFHQIRGFGPLGAQSDAFEELASQILPTLVGGLPAASRLERFGNPDGGREGRVVLEDGSTWCWQAKYVFQMDASTIGQITSSMRRICETEPTVSRILVALPYDLPAGDTAAARSAHTRWIAGVETWKALFDHEVAIEYVGAHEIHSALLDAANHHRLRYWFDKELLTPEWCRQRVEHAIADAGPRYSPEHHVALDIAEAFEGLGRTDRFEDAIREVLAGLIRASRFGFRAPRDTEKGTAELEVALEPLPAMLAAARTSLDGAAKAAQTTGSLADPSSVVAPALDQVRLARRLLEPFASPDGRYFSGDAATLFRALQDTLYALSSVEDLPQSKAWSAANSGTVLLLGEAGTGKTHLLCDLAHRRIEDGRATLLLLGPWFDARQPQQQIPGLLSFDGSFEDLLDALETAGETQRSPAMLVIDAVNEAADNQIWLANLASLQRAISARPHIVLAISCRSGYVDHCVPPALRANATVIHHYGFLDTSPATFNAYLAGYGIERPAAPPLLSEFRNPLFLSLMCRSLKMTGRTQFPRHGLSLTDLFSDFFANVNRTLAAASRCDYDAGENLVGRVVRSVILEEDRTGTLGVPTAWLRVECENLHGNRPWSRSLLKGLLDEGIITRAQFGSDDRCHLGYQTLSDFEHARLMSERSLDEIRDELRDQDRVPWHRQGLYAALSVYLPERYATELPALVADEEGRTTVDWAERFIAGLPFRSSEFITTQTQDLVTRCLDHPDLAAETWRHLLSLASVPGHPLNADWWHSRLLDMTLPERDRTWTRLCNQHFDLEDDDPADALVDWAIDPSRATADGEVERLTAQSLGWMLTATRRRLRDRATKAITAALLRRPEVAPALLRPFAAVNDPYVAERLLAAVAGAVLRGAITSDGDLSEAACAVAGGDRPLHLLMRDYLRRIQGTSHGPSSTADGQAVPAAVWPLTARSEDEIEAISGDDHQYAPLTAPLLSHGEFRRKEVEPLLQHFGAEEAPGVDLVSRRLFDRCLELGWAPELFRDYDRNLGGFDSRSDIEPIARKYQWIALAEVTGLLVDRFQVGDAYSDRRSPFTDPSELGIRDIDPTLLVTHQFSDVYDDHPRGWFCTDADPVVAADRSWLGNVANLPDPRQVIERTDLDGLPWIVLEGHYTWTQHRRPDEQADQLDYGRIWYQLRSYLVPTAELDAVLAWARDRDWYGRWMPESWSRHGVLLFDHPDGPGWPSTEEDSRWWHGEPEPPATLTPTADVYHSSDSLDASLDKPINAAMPSAALKTALSLSHADDFRWVADGAGADETLLFNPSLYEPAPQMLLARRDRLTESLAEAGLSLLVTVLGEKQLLGSWQRIDDDHSLLSVSACYALTGDSLDLVHARTTSIPRAGERRSIPWEP